MQEVINEVSALTDIHPDIIEKAIRSEFEFVKNTMESGNLETVHLHYLGKFTVKPGRLKKLQELTLDINKPIE